MNREQLYKLLNGLEDDGIICYAYRETVFSILSDGKCDGTVYLITDASAAALSDALMKRNFKEITHNGDGIDAKLAQQNVRIRLIGGDMEKLSKTICQPLTVCSMMLRADGGVYDELGGMDDLNGKVLRKTAAPIRDKNYFCTLCFELVLKRGFTPDAGVRDEMKRVVTLPLSKKIQLLLLVRAVLKSRQFQIEYVLNSLTFDGLFSNAGDLSRCKKSELDARLRNAEADKITLLLCFLAGIKGEQLKSIPNFGYEKEFYENLCLIIKENKTANEAEIAKLFTGKNDDAGKFVTECCALLSGQDFGAGSPANDLFRKLNASELWKFEEEISELPSPDTECDCGDDGHAETEQSAAENMEELLGGIEDDGYEAEYTEEEIPIVDHSRFGLRNPADNHYIRK